MKGKRKTRPIRKTLTLAMLITSTSGLVITGLVFISYMAFLLQKDTVNDISIHAQRTGANCIFSLSFEDQKDAKRILEGLNYVKGFESVAIYRNDESLFIEHTRPSGTAVTSLKNSKRPRRIRSLTEPIMSGDEKLGHITIVYNMNAFYSALYHSLLVLIGGILAAVPIAILIGYLFQRMISNPIEELSSTARKVAKTANYNLRTELQSEDEIGELADNFNRMLSEVQKRDRELLDNEARFRTLVDDAVDPILLIKPNGQLSDCNLMATNSLIYSKPELLNVKITTLIEELTPESFEETWAATCSGQHPTINSDMVCKDDSTFPAEIKFGSISHKHETLLLAFCRDITERKMAEEKLRLTEENLRQSQKMDAIGKLAGGVAHDFNNMLVGIVNSAELIQSSDTNPGQQHYVDLILSSAKKAASLTEKLLTFSRKKTLEYAPFNINDNVRDAIAILKRSVDPLIKIVENYETSSPYVSGDAALIQSMVLNLAINARDAMENQGELKIETSLTNLTQDACQTIPFDLSPRKYVCIKVSDTGSGIPEEIIDKIFDPFFTTKEIGKGTGMGLSSAYGTILEHSGAIMVDTEIGKGSTFTIYLPALNKAPELASPQPEIITNNQSTLKKACNILLIDDEPTVRTIVAAMLDRMEHTVITAEDGVEGIKVYQENQNKIDLIIVDMLMPEMNGTDCILEIKKMNPNVRAIMASGFTEDATSNSLIQDGIAAFLRKPFEMKVLEQTIASVLAASEKPGAGSD